MMTVLIGMTFILYSINMNIYMMMQKDFSESANNSFFNMLKHYGMDTYKFMKIYQSIMYKSTFVFVIMGIIVILRG